MDVSRHSRIRIVLISTQSTLTPLDSTIDALTRDVVKLSDRQDIWSHILIMLMVNSSTDAIGQDVNMCVDIYHYWRVILLSTPMTTPLPAFGLIVTKCLRVGLRWEHICWYIKERRIRCVYGLDVNSGALLQAVLLFILKKYIKSL